MKNAFDIRKHISWLLDGNISVRQMTDFVHFTRSIVEAYVLNYRSNVLSICVESGLSVSDLSIDCIGELFGRNDNDEYYLITAFVQSLEQPLDQIPDSNLFYAYKSFVLRIANAHLARMYAKIDPAGARIHRNIKEAVKKSPNLVLNEDSRGYFIHLRDGELKAPFYSLSNDILERELFSDSYNASIPRVLERLVKILNNQQNDHKYVRLVDFVQVVKKYFSEYAVQRLDNNDIDSNNEITSLDLTILQREILHDIHDKIFSTYVLSGKINKNEAYILFAIMYDIVQGICNEDKTIDSYYTTVKKHINISKDEYNTFWRAKIEYLSRTAREKFRLYLMDRL